MSVYFKAFYRYNAPIFIIFFFPITIYCIMQIFSLTAPDVSIEFGRLGCDFDYLRHFVPEKSGDYIFAFSFSLICVLIFFAMKTFNVIFNYHYVDLYCKINNNIKVGNHNFNINVGDNARIVYSSSLLVLMLYFLLYMGGSPETSEHCSWFFDQSRATENATPEKMLLITGMIESGIYATFAILVMSVKIVLQKSRNGVM